ncbi:MAG: translation initiation factor IF-2 [Fermentimonas sp.]|jgi:translation initiation factor IF-2
MAVRLIKVSKNLNVGINTIVEFLQKKGIEVEANPNIKIDDEHYALLVKEFGDDKEMLKEAMETREKMNQREDKRETVAIEGHELEEDNKHIGNRNKGSIKTEIPEDLKPKVNVLGTIDLGKGNMPIHNKPEEETKEPEKEEDKVEAIKDDIVTEEAKSEEQPTVVETEEKKVEVAEKEDTQAEKETEKDELPVATEEKEEEKTLEPTEEAKNEEIAEKAETETKSKDTDVAATEKEAVKDEKKESSDSADKSDKDEIFRIKSNKIEPSIVVVDTIDLDAINDRTRPPRRDRKDRGKNAQGNTDSKRLKDEKVKQLKKEAINEKKNRGDSMDDMPEDGKRKRRKRIRSSKVNIDKADSYNQGSRNDRRSLRKKPFKAEVSDEDVQKQIKETLARLTEKRGRKAGARYRREKREATAMRQQEEQKLQQKRDSVLQITEFVTANDLANMMDVSVTEVISVCMSLGVMVSINQRLDAEIINLVAEEFGFKTEFVSADVVETIAEVEDDPEDLVPRPPIVTVMGHVDHGKTSLLDSIRSTNVIAGEAGGITQHIGAYNVKLPSGRRITFLDTPGHEAFTAMRARGAKVTDVAIIIVAADDSVMPQTVEAINHATAAGVPIVFAINKIDKPSANPDKIKEKLAEMNYLVEDWGGKYQSQDISAKKGIGITELLEKVLLEADMLELKANPNRNATGSIIESELDKGRGYVSTILVENGTLKQGDIVIAGSYFGRVKAMFNERNQRIEQAGPSEPALILGLNGAPQAGDQFNVMETEQEARAIATRREQLQREQSMRTQKMLTLDDIGRRIAIGNFQQLNIIVKGDVDGSVEALSDSLIRLSTDEIQVNVIHKAVGQITESDVTLAAASDGIIIGFQVRPSLGARKEAEKDGVDIRLYSIIYDAIEEVTAAMEGMLSPDIKEEITGNLEVLEVFKVSKVGTVAGCMVRDGKIKRTSNVRLIRDGIVIFTGQLDSLKRFKDDVKEVSSGYECGVTIHNFNDIKVGDVIEAYEEIEVNRTL